jgi:choline-sulfatase
MHGATVYDEVVEVPLVLAGPGLAPGRVVPSQVSLVDLMPTLAEFAGAPLDGLDGRSLLPLVDGTEAGDRPALVVGTNNGAVSQLALRLPPWKLIHHVESGAEEAYRLDLDPRELESRPEDVPAELRVRLETELADVSRERLSAEDEALVERRLADLGYL